MSTRILLVVTGLSFLLVCGSSFYLYTIGGIVRDVPELGLFKASRNKNQVNEKRNIHNEYNARIHDLDKTFSDSGKIRVLIIGNSFARDFANVLLESTIGRSIEISYLFKLNNPEEIKKRMQKADYIFFSEMEKAELLTLDQAYQLDTTKAWNVGTKNFGSNNGIFYNKKHDFNYCKQRTMMQPGFVERNDSLKTEWGRKYVDLIGLVIDEEGKVPVFTPDCKFVSQDCSHLTEAGAKYLASLIDVNAIFKAE